MKGLFCTQCGGNEWKEENGYRICQFCNTKFIIPKTPTISLGGDIDALLQKCREDPSNAKKYASLILDIDPTNKEALAYLKRR